MTTTHTIGSYRLLSFTKQSSESNTIAEISFYNEQNQYIRNMRFYKECQLVPDNSEFTTSTPRWVYLHSSENQLDGIVDMLRNEKPCSVYYGSPTSAYVYTGKEPVGEEESDE